MCMHKDGARYILWEYSQRYFRPLIANVYQNLIMNSWTIYIHCTCMRCAKFSCLAVSCWKESSYCVANSKCSAACLEGMEDLKLSHWPVFFIP